VKFKPHSYQQFAIEYLEEKPIAAILLEMGLGKTSITLTALSSLLFDSFKIHKILIIAPLRVARDTWPAEIEKWSHLKDLIYSVAIGSEPERKAAFSKKADIYIINRENVKWLVEDSPFPFDFDTVVIDELSSFKNHQAKRFKSLMKVRPKIKRVIGLTGTPASNGLMDLWAEFRILDMGKRLGRFIGNFRETYFVPDKRNQQIVFSYKAKPGAEEAIYRLISDITISMKGSDYLKLPDLVMNEIEVKLNGEEAQILDSMKRDLIITLKDKEITAANAAALSGKLLQMANGAVYSDEGEVKEIHGRKLDALEDVVEAANGKPVLIAYWYKHDLRRIIKRFPAESLDSADSIRRWNKGEIPIAIIHPASAGHGLNLQAGGSTLVWFGLTWSLELYQQTNARLWRQGQKNAVVIHHLISKGTIDENVMKALKNKDNTQSALIDAVKANFKKGARIHG
jgi:SNF2 family DNA or RNA helicase